MTVTKRSAFFRTPLQAATLLILVTGAADAAAWRTCGGNNIRWNSSRADMYISTTSFPVGSTWDSALQNSMWHWNNVKGSGFNFYVGRDTDGQHSRTNGVNEVYFSSTDAGSALAITLSRYHCYWALGYRYGIDETDIAFSTNVAWKTTPLTYDNLGSPYSFEGVALHELGHAQGLLHQDDRMATMNAHYPMSGGLGYYNEWDPLADDRRGVRALYPDGITETDVGGSAFIHLGPGTSWLVASPLSAARGSYTTIEFTFSNLSTASTTFDIGFYLSTNNFISTSDRLVGMNYGAWGSTGFTGTFSRTLYIPADVTPGLYYLGFLIDPANAMGEANEYNNIQAMPRTISIY